MIRSQINGLLSDAQVAHILRHLTNTGMVSLTTTSLLQFNIVCVCVSDCVYTPAEPVGVP